MHDTNEAIEAAQRFLSILDDIEHGSELDLDELFDLNVELHTEAE